jgi:branched-chain amino acid transport system ATP-binding protein
VLATPKARSEDLSARADAYLALHRVGLESKSDEQAGTLTASEHRRLMLASALATSPRVLLLDEISAGGTVEDVRHLGGILGRLRERGLAILLVEHNLRLVRAVADHVVVLDQGQLIAAGPPDEVRADARVQEAYLGRHRL